MKSSDYHYQLKHKMDEFVHLVYAYPKDFPKAEVYGVTSQLRRSALSVILNYIEGFARVKSKVHMNFLEISYGSLKESKYLIYFSYKEGYLSEKKYHELIELADGIGGMLWGIMKSMDKKLHVSSYTFQEL